jgi:hypothetical protein
MFARRVPAAFLGPAALLGAGLALATTGSGRGVAPEVPLPGAGWEVESVMVLDPQSPTTYALAPPFRVTRDGGLVCHREVTSSEVGSHPILLRVDLAVRGQHVTLFARAKVGPVDAP